MSEIFKVTLYMTVSQWRAMSKWNIGHLENGDETWLLLKQESCTGEEYERALHELQQGAARALRAYEHDKNKPS